MVVGIGTGTGAGVCLFVAGVGQTVLMPMVLARGGGPGGRRRHRNDASGQQTSKKGIRSGQRHGDAVSYLATLSADRSRVRAC